jgi:hypothetical protein
MKKPATRKQSSHAATEFMFIFEDLPGKRVNITYLRFRGFGGIWLNIQHPYWWWTLQAEF